VTDARIIEGTSPQRTMTRHERIAAAAARYGMTEPSPDDVLMEHWTRYNDDAIHTRGYHEDYEAVMRAVASASGRRFCKVCGCEMDGVNGNRRYCGPCREALAGVRDLQEVYRRGGDVISATLHAAGLIRRPGPQKRKATSARRAA
jgi:cytochrome c1